MKNITLSLILCCFVLTGHSQTPPTNFKFGVKGGTNFSKLSLNSTLNIERKMGYYAGLWARIGGRGTHLQTELSLNGKNSALISASKHKNEVKFTTLDLPVLLGTKIGIGAVDFRINTGPVFALLLSKEQNFEETAPIIYRSKFKDSALAWQFGLGLDFGKFSIDGRHEVGLSDISSANGYPPTRLNLYTVGLGFAIF